MRPSKHSICSAIPRLGGIVILGLLAISTLSVSQAQTQVPGLPSLGQGSGNSLGGLAGGLPSVSQAGPANLAGVIQYCIQNNLLSSGTAGSTQSALLGQVPGGAQSSDYAAGSGGQLDTGNNQTYSLSGVQSQVKQQVCNMVLQQGKSLL